MYLTKCAAFLSFFGFGVLVTASGVMSTWAAFSFNHIVLGTLLILYSSRVGWQLGRWRRNVHWLEATVESWILLPLVVVSCVILPLPASNVLHRSGEKWMRGAGWVVCAGCNLAIVLVERQCESLSRGGSGLCSKGWYAVVRHPNYTLEILSFVGMALAGGPEWWWRNLWVPGSMAVGMVWWSVLDLESYLAHQHSHSAVGAWRKRVPWALCPHIA